MTFAIIEIENDNEIQQDNVHVDKSMSEESKKHRDYLIRLLNN